MGERQLTPEERQEFDISYERSSELVEEIYRNVLAWKLRDMPGYQVRAHELKNALVEELEDYLPLYMPNIYAASPPAHARIRGRREYTPIKSNMEGGLKKTRRNRNRRGRRAHSR